MGDKQTTALFIIVLTSFLFWLYNTKDSTGRTKLAVISDTIRGNNSVASGVNNLVSPATPNAAIAPVAYNDVNGSGLETRPVLNMITQQVGMLLHRVPETDYTGGTGTAPSPGDFYNPLGVHGIV